MKRLLMMVACLSAALCVRGQAMPPGLPSLELRKYQQRPLDGHLFIGTERFVLPATLPSTAMILDPEGTLLWYASSEENLFTFGPQPSGILSFNVADTWYALDSTLNPTVVPTCAGIAGDFHDFVRLADGRSFELCNADTTMDLRSLSTHTGQQGDSAASVRYALVRELDAGGALLRTWRAIDHISISQADTHYFDFPWYLELTHTNSIAVQGDQVLLSHRNIHAVTNIYWPTGQVLWQVGGVENDFFYLNDIGFDAQHDAQFAGPGRISLLDNRSTASNRTPRAVVYELDTALGLATKVSERLLPGGRSNSMGSYRLLPNGDELACWGLALPDSAAELSYYDSTGQLVASLYLTDEHHIYRALCGPLPFSIPRPTIVCTRQGNQLLLSAATTHASYLWSEGSTSATIAVSTPGDYQLYVPLGMGRVGSNVIHVTDPQGDCPAVAMDPESLPRPLHDPVMQRWDILGRVVEVPVPGQLHILLYRSGKVELRQY